MKKSILLFGMMMFTLIPFFTSCQKDPDPLSVATVLSGTTDLAGVTAATNVDVDENIVITFNKNVKEATVQSAITLAAASNVALTITVAGKEVTLAHPTLDPGTTYTLTIANTLVADDDGKFEEFTISFKTYGKGIVTPPQSSHLVAYWLFDGNTTPYVGSFTTAYEKVSYTTDRGGFTNSALSFGGAATAGTGDLVEINYAAGLVSPSMTFSFWFKVDEADYTGSKFVFGLGVERGYFMELGAHADGWFKIATSHKLNPDPMSHGYGTAWTDPNGDGSVGGQTLFDYTGSISDLIFDGDWHQLIMTFDAATSIKTIYLDGAKLMQVDLDLDATEWYLKDMEVNEASVTGLVKNLALGYACSKTSTATDWANYSTATNSYKGLMDDFRIFNIALTSAEVTTLYNAEK
jgi:hypothetical protein